MNELVLWAQGGLGNQLFQLNAALNLLRGDTQSLRISTENYRRDRLRGYEMAPLVREIRVLSRLEMLWYGSPYSRDGELRASTPRGGYEILRDAGTPPRNRSFLVGFFQDQASLDAGVARTLSRLANYELSPTAELTKQRVRGKVAVHVRRGDYATSPSAKRTFGELRPDYFLRGLAELGTSVSDATFFTDDPGYVKGTFDVRDEQIIASRNLESPLETIVVMGSSAGIIIPNSTFSWWAGEIVHSNGGIVVAPATWFHDRPHDLSPHRGHWKQIPNDSGTR